MKRLKGLHLDNEPIDQPQGTYSYAQNILLGKKKGAISNEEGTTINVDLVNAGLAPGATVIGETFVYDGSHILFIVDGADSVIATFDGNSTYSEVIRDSSLTFDATSILEAVAVINNQGERVVYWTDNINPPRFLNIDKQIADGATTVADLDTLRLFPTLNQVPYLEFGSVGTGGSLRSGAYHFAIKLIAEDNSETNYVNVTPPVYIGTGLDGAVAGTITSNLIQMDVANLDQEYDQYQIAVIRKEQGTIAEVIELDPQDITSETSQFTYQGTEGIESAFENVIIDNASYERARTIIEQDNTLYLGNLARNSAIDFQKYANNITVSATSKDLPGGINGTVGNYRNNEVSFYDKSFKRGEVYALYVAFALRNGGETRAFHIPGRQAEGTELDANTDLPGLSAKNYQIRSDAGTNGMAYWENENETYPAAVDDDDGRWEVWEVNSSGVGVPVDDPQNPGNTLTIHGENVRHHHFPEGSYYDGDTVTANTLGFTLSNFFIPEDILEQIVGVKVYYAKRDPLNQRILDQGFMVPYSLVDHDFTDYYNFDPYQSKDGNDNYNTVPAARINCFHATRTQKTLSLATHIKVVALPRGTAEADLNPGGDELQFNDQSLQVDYAVPSDKKFAQIKNGTAITYLTRNQVTEGTNIGFDFDLYNIEAENGVAVQFADDINMGDVDYNISEPDGPTFSNKRYGYIVEIQSLKTDMYENFGSQELVWTGNIFTDLDVFSKTATSPIPDALASGVITITQGADADAGTKATGQLVVQSVSGTNGSFTLDVTVDGTTYSDTVPINWDDPVSLVASQIASVINLNEGSTYSAVSDDDTVTVTAVNSGTGANGVTISAFSVQQSGDASANISSATLSGGGPGQLDFTFSSAGLGFSETVSLTITDNQTKDSIATDLHAALTGLSNITTNYNLTLTTGITDPTIEIEAVAFGSASNAGLTYDAYDTGIIIDDNNVTGGSSSGEAGTGSGSVTGYGGDTFICVYGTRLTGTQSANKGNQWRILIKTVVESYDNIEYRHQGGNEWEVYYPASDPETVLGIEGDDATGDSAIGTANYLGYNVDYSEHAIYKVPTPAGFNLETTTFFPTRIIRSLQGDTNVGEDIGLRTFLENDFIDLTRKRGQLVKLSILQNIIIPHMERAVIRTKARQEMLVGDIRAFVGAGDIFSVDPDEITTTEVGFGGLQDQRCAMTTPYGYFFVDRKAGQAVLLGENPEVISDYGLHNYFSDNVASLSNANTLICAYDPEWKRIILTCNDPGNEFTLSYYPERKCWGSFHTYYPDFYFHNVDTFFSVANDDINEHNVPAETGFIYGSAAPMIFEFIDNRSPNQSKYTSAVKFDTEVVDTNGSYLYQETFNTIRVSNNHQDSDDVTLTPYTFDNGNCRHVEGNWFTNDFRDLIENGSINTAKAWYDKARFISQFIRVRLVYNNADKKSLYLHSAEAVFRVSKR